ncbi:MAG: type II pantothenate kinase [Oscillospiraceae bacterium]|nr:type II pantothenate kinase [Oscillospiraceae bacterium]
MKTVIGIDIGGSTTKICGFDSGRNLIAPLFVKANDPTASFYGAFGKFTQKNRITLSDVEKIMITGVGSSFVEDEIYGIRTEHIEEFTAIGLGGLYLSEIENAIIVSMGTGTATVRADAATGTINYLGGTGIGGGTLVGLSKLLLNMQDIEHICLLAEDGELGKVDLRISDITRKNIIPTMPKEMTAANFGRVSDIATNADIALGIINLVFETIGMIAIFASRQYGINEIVLTGNLTLVKQASQIFTQLGIMFGKKFIIPQGAQFGTVIGAALKAFK